MFDELKRALGHERCEQAIAGLRFACISNTGCKRPHNEDNFLFFGQVMEREHQSLDEPLASFAPAEELVVAGVFDGMGGEQAGEAASYAAALRLSELLPTIEPDEESVLAAYASMQEAVRDERAVRRLSRIGSTAVTLVARGGTAAVANLGDSPAFLLSGSAFSELSIAHTDAELMRELGLDRRPGLTQYLGMDESDAPIEPNIVSLELAPADRILLASDGLTDMVPPDAIALAMADAADPEELVARLCARALEAGGEDNITIIACEAASAAPSKSC